MKRFDRYLGSEFLKSFIFALFGLVFMFFMLNVQEALRIQTDAPKEHLYRYLGYLLPGLIVYALPPGLMFGVCFTVAQFSVSREMVAMHSAGVSFYRAVATILIASAAISIFVFFFQNFVVTPANELAGKELAIVKKSKGPGKDIIWQKNLRGKQGYYFIYYFNKEKLSVSGGFHYLEMNGSKPARTLQARKATYNPQTQNWLLEECTLTTFKDPAAIESIQNFNTYETTFPDPIDFFYKPNRDPLELNVVELWNEVQERKQTGSGLVPYAVQFHANISFPFMSFIVAIVGVIAGGMGSLRSSGPLIRSLLLSTATIFIYEMLFRLGVNLGVNGLVPPFVAGWGPTVIFFLTAVYLIWRNRR